MFQVLQTVGAASVKHKKMDINCPITQYQKFSVRETRPEPPPGQEPEAIVWIAHHYLCLLSKLFFLQECYSQLD